MIWRALLPPSFYVQHWREHISNLEGWYFLQYVYWWQAVNMSEQFLTRHFDTVTQRQRLHELVFLAMTWPIKFLTCLQDWLTQFSSSWVTSCFGRVVRTELTFRITLSHTSQKVLLCSLTSFSFACFPTLTKNNWKIPLFLQGFGNC